jgi:hypothetical protein
MATRSFDQAFRILELIREKNPSSERLQSIFNSGLLGDLFDGNVDQVNRDEFRKILGLSSTKPEPKIFKTLTLGLRKSPKAYHKALESAGFRIGDYASQILNKISVATTQVEVDLVLVTVAELGFKDGARRDAIYARALELDLQLCPAEVGPALRLATKDSPWILVGMGPMAGSVDDLYVFHVRTDRGARWLHSDSGLPGNFWHGDSQWVFVRPRK